MEAVTDVADQLLEQHSLEDDSAGFTKLCRLCKSQSLRSIPTLLS